MMKAGVFDLDGTLVDTFQGHYKSFRDTFKDLEVEFTVDEFRLQFGKLAPKIVEDVLDGKGVEDFDAEKLADRKQEYFRERYVGETQVFDGVIDLLDAMREDGWSIGVASNGDRKNIDLILEATELSEYFEVVVAGAEVDEPKPAPDLFLEVAGRLDAAAEECIVFEDSVHGIQAAVAAGMGSVAVTTGGAAKGELEEAEADVVVDSLSKVDVDLLEEII